MAKLQDVHGIGATYANKLNEQGIKTQADLLTQGGKPDGRKAIAEKTGIGETLILKWLNRADLARIKGVGEQYADLLECVGVDTVPELGQRNAKNLHETMEKANEEKKLVKALPVLSQVEGWVEQAKKLDRALFY